MALEAVYTVEFYEFSSLKAEFCPKSRKIFLSVCRKPAYTVGVTPVMPCPSPN
jgi:hypothetical protein